MITVTVMIPYPELHDMAESALRDNCHPGVVYAITNAYAYGTNVDSLHFGDSDIILARGLTQQTVKHKYRDATVLELTISAYDILRAVHECRQAYGARRIAIMSSNTSLYDVRTLEELIGAELRVFTVRNEEDIRKALEEAARLGCDAVVGGLTACKIAEALGWRSTFLRTSEETFRVSIKEAMNTASVMFNERAKAEISRTILQNAKEAILYFDQDAALTMFNRRVHEILNLVPGESIAGRKVAELFSDAEIVDLVRSRQERQGLIKNINNAMLISDYVPVRVAEQVIGVICTFRRVNEIQATENMIRKKLSKKGLVARYCFDNIIHASPALAGTIGTANKYSRVDANVLLIGETGTGKEMFAQSIHNASSRQLDPFVAVNCASFPENLLESELFGYADGAFSGATRGGKTGLFELAHGGTMFLDEIGEIPPNLQATLLRALQEREIRKIGDDKVIPVNVRIIAATNRDLREKVRAGQFRMDLLYRLDVLSLSIPPLRQHREDIRIIADYYIQRYRLKYGKPGLRLGDDALAALQAYDWPGNVRELRNVCERLSVLCDDATTIDRSVANNILALSSNIDLSQSLDAPPPADKEPQNIDQLVQFAASMRVNKADIAQMLGISRTTLWRRTKENGNTK